MTKPSSVAILGAGSWGTAVAIHIAKNGHDVFLWSKDLSHNTAMRKDRSNDQYLPGSSFPESLHIYDNLGDAVQAAQNTVIAVPSHAFREVLEAIEKPIRSLAWITKGIDPDTNQLLSKVVAEKYGEKFPMAMISGPSFAKEVAKGMPTAITIAGNDHPLQMRLHTLLHHHHLRAYLSDDFIGVQLCGAMKNVLAIACGISDGMGYGANAKAALITRGLAEMHRLGKSIGASDQTFMGLAGMGDLVLTCTDDQSRNRRFGLKVGKGMSVDQALKEIQQVVEGKHNAKQVCTLAASMNVEVPICSQVYALVTERLRVEEAVEELFNRPPKDELLGHILRSAPPEEGQ